MSTVMASPYLLYADACKAGAACKAMREIVRSDWVVMAHASSECRIAAHVTSLGLSTEAVASVIKAEAILASLESRGIAAVQSCGSLADGLRASDKMRAMLSYAEAAAAEAGRAAGGIDIGAPWTRWRSSDIAVPMVAESSVLDRTALLLCVIEALSLASVLEGERDASDAAAAAAATTTARERCRFVSKVPFSVSFCIDEPVEGAAFVDTSRYCVVLFPQRMRVGVPAQTRSPLGRVFYRHSRRSYNYYYTPQMLAKILRSSAKRFSAYSDIVSRSPEIARALRSSEYCDARASVSAAKEFARVDVRCEFPHSPSLCEQHFCLCLVIASGDPNSEAKVLRGRTIVVSQSGCHGAETLSAAVKVPWDSIDSPCVALARSTRSPVAADALGAAHGRSGDQEDKPIVVESE
jgi:hypothetical protein